MDIQLKWKYAEGEFDTKTMKLICLPAREVKHEKNAELCIKDEKWNVSIAEILLGDRESSNALCEEIARRFNEFPQELKR